MRSLAIGSVTVLLAVLLLGQQTAGQSLSLSLSLFERYLEPLRVEAGIPGLSVSVLRDGATVWERGFGRQDLDSALAATPSTPYVIGGLAQTLGATLLLRKCIEEGSAELSDPVVQWAPAFSDPSSTLRDVLTHSMPAAGFLYDIGRFAGLTPVVEACADAPYSQILVEEVFERLGMAQSVPAPAMAAMSARDRAALGQGRMGHYSGILERLAVPYRVDARSRSAARTTAPPTPGDTATGIVSTVQDLARFDSALDAGVLLLPETRTLAWTQAWPLPTGFGWFVQAYNGEPLVWQFGMVKDAYSSLILKAPNRRVTLIMLANSDGLSAPFMLESGDVTTSVFAKLFLRLLVV